jgi:hypothetical protein
MFKKLRALFDSVRLRKENSELRDLVLEMYRWTNYKDTHWARRARRVLNLEKD